MPTTYLTNDLYLEYTKKCSKLNNLKTQNNPVGKWAETRSAVSPASTQTANKQKTRRPSSLATREKQTKALIRRCHYTSMKTAQTKT